MEQMPLTDLGLAGIEALRDYIATHVLTCLVPAFLLAGAMVTFINRAAVLTHLGREAGWRRSFCLAALASPLVAACSCTVIPVAAGLYFAGAGIGAAFIVLWVAPATNVLALVYTGNVLGAEMVLARIGAALLIAFVIGGVMSGVFRREERARQQTAAAPAAATSAAPSAEPIVGPTAVGLFALLLVTLLAPNYLAAEGPYLHKVAVWGVFTLATAAFALALLPRSALANWLRQTWWFVRTIFPLLVIGVFLVGVVTALLPEAWIERWLGGDGLLASILATLIGGVTYFATMTEAPFVDRLMDLGMGPGPALALLLAGPGVSLPNWLAIARVFGWRKAMVYAPTIMLLAALAGWTIGKLFF